MSLYVGNDIASTSSSGGRVLASSWCRVESMLAVSTEDCAVDFYLDEGEAVEGSSVRRGCCATAMDWRLRSSSIAIGWADGVLSVWSVKNKSVKENGEIHGGSSITWAGWSPEGTRLVTTDDAGRFGVWKTDHRSRLISLASGALSSRGAVTCCAWVVSAEYRAKQSDIATAPDRFVLATDSGHVHVCGIDGSVVDAGKEASAVSHAMWFEHAEQLVVLTKECMMSVYAIDAAAGSARISTVKLSMTAAAVQTGLASVVWTCPGLLATAANEQFVRFWDVLHDESYALPVAAASESSRRGTGVVLAFASRRRILAVGTREATVALYSFVGDYGSSSNAVQRPESTPKDWMHTLTLSVAATPTSLAWDCMAEMSWLWAWATRLDPLRGRPAQKAARRRRRAFRVWRSHPRAARAVDAPR